MKRAVPYIALLICIVCGYLAYFDAARIVYQYKQSTWFSTLEKQEAERLRETTRTTLALSLSTMFIQNTASSIQNNVSRLAKIRKQAPQDLRPVLDLRLAKDYAMMARLEQRADNPTAAAEHQQAAKVLLVSLGWQDVSDSTVAGLADGQLRSRLKR
jgi:hypothetical protein